MQFIFMISRDISGTVIVVDLEICNAVSEHSRYWLAIISLYISKLRQSVCQY